MTFLQQLVPFTEVSDLKVTMADLQRSVTGMKVQVGSLCLRQVEGPGHSRGHQGRGPWFFVAAVFSSALMTNCTQIWMHIIAHSHPDRN